MPGVEDIANLVASTSCEVYAAHTCRWNCAPGYGDGTTLELETTNVAGISGHGKE